MKESGFFAEFRKFISRGNVMDMAVGIVVGSSFTAIVNSLVNDIIMPVVGLLTGGIDFKHFRIVLKAETETTPEVAIYYGVFINAVISFLIVSLAIFCFIKALNKLKDNAEKRKKEEEKEKEAETKIEEATPEPPSEEVVLLTEIRDLLKK